MCFHFLILSRLFSFGTEKKGAPTSAKGATAKSVHNNDKEAVHIVDDTVYEDDLAPSSIDVPIPKEKKMANEAKRAAEERLANEQRKIEEELRLHAKKAAEERLANEQRKFEEEQRLQAKKATEARLPDFCGVTEIAALRAAQDNKQRALEEEQRVQAKRLAEPVSAEKRITTEEDNKQRAPPHGDNDPNRIVACPHCGAKVPLGEARHHTKVCPNVPVTCPKCHTTVRMCEARAHTKVCPAVVKQ